MDNTVRNETLEVDIWGWSKHLGKRDRNLMLNDKSGSREQFARISSLEFSMQK